MFVVFKYFMKGVKCDSTRETIEERLSEYYPEDSLIDVLISLMSRKQPKNQFIINLHDTFHVAERYYDSETLRDVLEDVAKVITDNQKAVNLRHFKKFYNQWLARFYAQKLIPYRGDEEDIEHRLNITAEDIRQMRASNR